MKKRTVSIITMVLMTIIEGVFIYILINKLKGEEYVKAGITLKNVLPYEIALYVFLIIAAHLIALTPEKKHFNFVNRYFIVHVIVMFYLISFRFVTYANFINGIIVVLFNNYLKFKNEKWNLWFHFFVVKVSYINYNLIIEG